MMKKIVSLSRIVLSTTILFAGSLSVADEKPKADAEEAKELTIGSVAPALDIEHWVSDGNGQFPPVTEFEDGRIYIVEFWATWCGPCISSMPHIVELQNKHAKDGVQVVSISDEDMETVNRFLERKYTPRDKAAEDEDQPATYGELTSAYCLTSDPDGSSETDYMRAASQNGIPCCFLVGKTGHVEWIGHPMSVDSVLESVIADKWDRESFASEFAASQKMDLAMSQASRLMRSGKFDEAVTLFSDLKDGASTETTEQLDGFIDQIRQFQIQSMVADGKVDEALKMIDEKLAAADEDGKVALNQQKCSALMAAGMQKEAAVVLEELVPKLEASQLNQVAWSVYESAAEEDSEVPKELVQAALAAAKKAVKDEPNNGAILDTLAHLFYVKGDLERAIKIQTRAVRHQDPPMDDITDFLKQLKKEAAEKKEDVE